MYSLSPKSDTLYTKLVRLADGNTGIVMRVLSKPGRRTVSLTTAIHEIEMLRDAARPGAAP